MILADYESLDISQSVENASPISMCVAGADKSFADSARLFRGSRITCCGVA